MHFEIGLETEIKNIGFRTGTDIFNLWIFVLWVLLNCIIFGFAIHE